MSLNFNSIHKMLELKNNAYFSVALAEDFSFSSLVIACVGYIKYKPAQAYKTSNYTYGNE